MLIRMRATTSVAALAAGLLILSMPPAGALTMKECSAKYQAAKTSGALGGQSWSDFRKTQCGTNAAATPAVSGRLAEPVGERFVKNAGRTPEVHLPPPAPATGAWQADAMPRCSP
jgi:hypothetical protein